MKKKFVIFLFLFSVGTLFAKQSLDNVIIEACKDIIRECSQKSFLAMNNIETPRIVIYNIKSPSVKMSIDIKDQISNILVLNKNIHIISDPESIAILDMVLNEQHQSGMYDETTIVNYARRVGANLIISGSVMENYDGYKFSLKMTVVEKAIQFYEKIYYFSSDKKTDFLLGRYSKASIGLGAELNKNSIDSIASACFVSFDYNLLKKISLGLKVFGSYDMYEKKIILEPLGFLRLYFLSPPNDPVTGIFIEGLGGVSFFVNDFDGKTSLANIGGGLGYRFSSRKFYIELAIRAGYPYIFGTGFNTGFRF